MRIRRKIFINQEIPNPFAFLSRVKSFVLSVTYAPKFLIGHQRFGSVTLADQLHNTFATVDLLSQNGAQISALRSEYILPDRLISQVRQSVRNQLPRAF